MQQLHRNCWISTCFLDLGKFLPPFGWDLDLFLCFLPEDAGGSNKLAKTMQKLNQHFWDFYLVLVDLVRFLVFFAGFGNVFPFFSQKMLVGPTNLQNPCKKLNQHC